jgi:hypothetical protein
MISRYSNLRESIVKVTGPSFVRHTFIIAPKRPSGPERDAVSVKICHGAQTYPVFSQVYTVDAFGPRRNYTSSEKAQKTKAKYRSELRFLDKPSRDVP